MTIQSIEPEKVTSFAWERLGQAADMDNVDFAAAHAAVGTGFAVLALVSEVHKMRLAVEKLAQNTH